LWAGARWWWEGGEDFSRLDVREDDGLLFCGRLLVGVIYTLVAVFFFFRAALFRRRSLLRTLHCRRLALSSFRFEEPPYIPGSASFPRISRVFLIWRRMYLSVFDVLESVVSAAS